MNISPDFKALFKPGTNVLRRQALSVADKETAMWFVQLVEPLGI